MNNLNIFIVFSALFFVSISSEVENTNHDTLILAHVMLRHGDRNPLPESIYPTDPWADPKHWPEGLGELTKLGLYQSYEAGQYLRRRYEKLLGNKSYSDNLVYIQSTDLNRIISMVAAAMAGLFPPSPDQIWHPELKWLPIPIHSIPTKLDHVISAERPCAKMERALEKYRESDEFKKEFARFKELFEYLEKHSGLEISSYRQVVRLYDTLWIEDLKNKTLPAWTKKVFFPGGDFEWGFNRYFQTYTMTTEMRRLYSGFFIREVLDHCTEKLKGTLSPNRSIFIYAAHDTTIASLLNSFGLYNFEIPPYAAALYLDLYRTSENKHYLQLSYKNSTEPMLLKFPVCGTKCSIEEFREIYREIIPTASFEEECRLPLHIKFLEGYDICGRDDCTLALLSLCIAVPLVLMITWAFFSWSRKRASFINDKMGANTLNHIESNPKGKVIS